MLPTNAAAGGTWDTGLSDHLNLRAEFYGFTKEVKLIGFKN